MKTTQYFEYTRRMADRARIVDEWILQAIQNPVTTEVQSDGRIRIWAWIEVEAKYLRVILLKDGETVHNAFFDRTLKPGKNL